MNSWWVASISPVEAVGICRPERGSWLPSGDDVGNSPTGQSLFRFLGPEVVTPSYYSGEMTNLVFDLKFLNFLRLTVCFELKIYI
jgi:hypothetical protein